MAGLVLEAAGGTATVEAAGHRFTARSGGNATGPAKILIRPEALRLASEGFAARVLDAVYRGPVYEVRLALPTHEELILDSVQALAVGERVHVACSDAWVIPTA